MQDQQLPMKRVSPLHNTNVIQGKDKSNRTWNQVWQKSFKNEIKDNVPGFKSRVFPFLDLPMLKTPVYTTILLIAGGRRDRYKSFLNIQAYNKTNNFVQDLNFAC